MDTDFRTRSCSKKIEQDRYSKKSDPATDGMFLAQGGAIGNGALAPQLALACSARGASSAPAVACRRWSRRRVRQQAEPPLRRKASSGVATTAYPRASRARRSAGLQRDMITTAPRHTQLAQNAAA